MSINGYKKGRRGEYRTIETLERAGYLCVRAASSKGAFDVVAVGATGIRCISVKCGTKYASGLEREQLQQHLAQMPGNATCEIWRWPDRARTPIIEVLERRLAP